MRQVDELAPARAIQTQEAARLTYILIQIRDSLVIQKREESQIIPATNPYTIVTVPSGYFLSGEQVEKIRRREGATIYGALSGSAPVRQN